ncbi:MAG: hypothetical protein M0R23_10075 [Bacteroidales bacterium]|nr:hypothetical protein [Bacteroidales bacterium]
MANNRMYIVNKDTREHEVLAKSNGFTWYVPDVKKIETFLNDNDLRGNNFKYIIVSENDSSKCNKYIYRKYTTKKCNERIAYGFILLSVIDLLSTIDFALKGDVFWSILSFVAFVLCGVYSVYLVAKVFNKGENK